MMKKLFFLVLFVLLSIACYQQVEAEQFNEGEYLPNLWVNKAKGGKIRYQQARYLRRQSDGKFSYCIEPWAIISGDAWYEEGIDVSKLSDHQLERMALIARYGFNHPNHFDQHWYYLTQVLIWREADPEADFYFTDRLNGKRITTYDGEMNEILELVNRHSITPEFGTQKIRLMVGERVTLTDQHHILETFVTPQGNEWSAIGNSLQIMAKTAGVKTIRMFKNDTNYENPPLVYRNHDYQDLLLVGKYPTVQKELELEVTEGSITIEKEILPNLTGIDVNLPLTGTTFEIHNQEDGTVRTVVLKDSNKIAITNLPSGRYFIREVSSSPGYHLDTERKEILLSSQKESDTVTFYNEIIQKKVIIKKLFGNSDHWSAEADVTFEVYDEKGKLLTQATTGIDGKLEFNLPYGTYTVKQINSKKNYTKVEDFSISVIDDQLEVKTLYDSEITGRITILKIDAETESLIKHAPAYFKIKNLTTNQWIDRIYQTDENGALIIDNLSLGTYQIVEVEAPIYYMLGDEEYTVTLDIGELNQVLEIKNQKVIPVPDTETFVRGEIYDDESRKRKYSLPLFFSCFIFF